MNHTAFLLVLVVINNVIIPSEKGVDAVLKQKLLKKDNPLLQKEFIEIGNKIIPKTVLKSLNPGDREIVKDISRPSCIAALYGINNQSIRKSDALHIQKLAETNDSFRKAIDGMVVDTIDTSRLWCPNRNMCCCANTDNEMSCAASGVVGIISGALGLAGLTGFITKNMCLVYAAAPIALTPPVITCLTIECGYCLCAQCCLKRERYEIKSGHDEDNENKE